MRKASGLLFFALLGCQPEKQSTTTLWQWDLPDHIPVPDIPEDNPMTSKKAELGRVLFYDFQLSGNGQRSCGICHEPAKGFTDGFVRSIGATGEDLSLNSLSVANVAWRTPLGWRSPDRDDLEAQAESALFSTHPIEMGAVRGDLEQYISKQDYYAVAFPEAFPDASNPYTAESVAAALAVHQRRLIAVDSPFDRHTAGEATLSDAALRGYALFKSDDLNCTACHGGPFFDRPDISANTDTTGARFANIGMYNLNGNGDYPEGRQGLFEVTGNPEDMGKFRTPSLRNVTLTGPWGHDGTFSSLESVLLAYARGGRLVESGPASGDGAQNPYKDFRIQGFEMSNDQLSDLIAFLHALADISAVENPDYADPFCRGSQINTADCIEPFTR